MEMDDPLDIPAPPYPGPPLDPCVSVTPPAAQPAVQLDSKPNPLEYSQEYLQQCAQQYLQDIVQQHPQEYLQQHPQVYLQQHPQEYLQQHPQVYLQQHPQVYLQQPPQEYIQQHPQEYLQQFPQQLLVPEQLPQQIVQPASHSVQEISYNSVSQQVQVVMPEKQVVVAQPKPTNSPGQMLCPQCQTTVVTVTKRKPGLLTWIICGSLAIVGCWPFCLIPFCVPDCQNVEHHCPTCDNILHIHKRM